jgi:hypothetical protein
MALRMLYFDQLPNIAGILIFLALGWGGAVTATVLWQRFGWKFVRSGVLAGFAYTIGAIALLLHRPVIVNGVIGPHELWHLAVLSGLGLHWSFVFQFAAGLHPGTEIGRFPRMVHPGPPHWVSLHKRKRSTLEPPHLDRQLSAEDHRQRPALRSKDPRIS